MSVVIKYNRNISFKECQIYSKTVFRNETITDVLGNKVVKTINQCSQTAIELIIGGELVSICEERITWKISA